ncbi:hypothetical protein MBAV_004423, partial [Candidatus Magnetobacterium bavaricum]
MSILMPVSLPCEYCLIVDDGYMLYFSRFERSTNRMRRSVSLVLHGTKIRIVLGGP